MAQHPSDAPWEVQPARPWWLLATGLLALLALDLVLSLVGAAAVDPTLAVDSRDDVRWIARKARDEGAFLFVGDSVLAGDVLRRHTPDWASERVLDHLRRESGPDAAPFEHVALSGALLGDILGVLLELDDVDPEGVVPIVIEVNPRYFSPVNLRSRCAHPWLCERVDAGRAGWLEPWQRGGILARDTVDALEPILPIARHRRALFPAFDPIAAIWGTNQGPTAGEAEGQARILAHYRDLALAPEAPPMRVLGRIAARLRESGRRAVLFQTPLNDGVVGAVATPSDLGAVSAAVADVVEGAAQFVELDHPLFRPDHFVDHCHLTVSGSRLLAVNLLNELGQPMRAVPPASDVVHPVAPDQTVVGNVEPGFANGPSWVARFAQPDGVALGPDGRVVVADTGNAVLRVSSPPYQTTRTLLGWPGDHRDVDGDARAARLANPRSPAFRGEELWFLTDGGARRFSAGELITATSHPTGGRFEQLVAVDDVVLVRDDAGAVWRIDGVVRRVFASDLVLTAMAATSGRLFLAAADGRILESRLDGTEHGLDDARVVFANSGVRVKGNTDEVERYPRAFADMKIDPIEGLHWVDRYAGLLVRYRDLPRREGLDKPDPGDVHWRFFDLERKQVVPWIRPRAFGSSHLMWNARSESFASDHHSATVAVDPATATTFELERGRSRLVRQRDGLLGMAQVSHAESQSVILGMREPFGDRAANTTIDRYDPAAYLGELGDPRPLRGPYVVLMVGASMLSMSDSVGQYGVTRVLEQRLRERLGYVDRTGVEVFARIAAGSTFPMTVDRAKAAAPGARPDVIVVDMWERMPPRAPHNPSAYGAALSDLLALGEAWHAPVVVVDTTPFDRLRAPPRHLVPRHQEVRAAGLQLLSLGGLFLHDHLATAPWGNPPFNTEHPAPWSVDVAADHLAEALHPTLQAVIAARPPNWTLGEPVQEVTQAGTVRAARTELEQVDATALPDVASSDATVTRDGDTLDVLLDLRDRVEPEAAWESLSAAVVLAVIRDNRSTDSARRLRVRLARFDTYDEYGKGALQGAQVAYERSWTPDELLAVAQRVTAP